MIFGVNGRPSLLLTTVGTVSLAVPGSLMRIEGAMLGMLRCWIDGRNMLCMKMRLLDE